MSTIMPELLGLVYFLCVVVLPIGTAVGFLRRKGHGPGMCLIAVGSSLTMGAIFLVITFLIVLRLSPPAHELWNAWGLFGGVILGFTVGAPLGTWIGAWATAVLINRHHS